MAEQPFDQYDGVCVFKEKKEKLSNKMPYIFATYGYQTEDGVFGERIYREGSEVDSVDAIEVGQAVILSFETQQNGARTFTKCTSVRKRPGTPTIVIK